MACLRCSTFNPSGLNRGRDFSFVFRFLFDEVGDVIGGVKRCLVGEIQSLDHVESALLVFLEMIRGYVAGVGYLARIGLEDGDHAGVVLFLQGVHCQYSRLGSQRYFTDLRRELYVFVNVLRPHLDL